MPFYKVPSPSSTSLPDAKRVRAPLRQSQTSSPDHASSSTPDGSSSASGSIQNFGALSDEDATYMNGGVTRGSWNPKTEVSSNDGMQRSFQGHQSKGRVVNSSITNYNKVNDVNGGNYRHMAVPDQQVSIVELEIQQQNEREAELLAMRNSLYQPQPLTPDPQVKRTSSNSDRVSNSESNVRTSTGKTNKNSHQSPNNDSFSLSPQAPNLLLSSSSSPSPPRPSSPPLPPPPPPLVMYEEAISSRSHPGETLIAKEIMELKQREEELHRHRREIGLELRESSVDDDDGHDMTSHTAHFVAPHLTRSSTSPDAYSNLPRKTENHTGGGVGVSLDTTDVDDRQWKRAPRIRPLDEPDTEAAASQFLPQEETPIEREMRLAREREDALRQARGLPAMSKTEKDAAVVEMSAPAASAGGWTHGPTDRKTDQTMKKLASSRLMVEIEKEKQRELELRRHWQEKPQTNATVEQTQKSAKVNLYNRKY